MQFRDLHAQYLKLKPQIDEGIQNAIESSRFISGPQVEELELRLAEFVGAKHCITCGNGTDALQLALMAWGIGEGDAVFVPDFTFFASGEAPAFLGATPVFVDVDAATYNIDAAKLAQAVDWVERNTDLKPRAVVAVDLFGLPADYPRVKEVCDRHGLLLLEDGAQGFGGAVDGRRACSFGDISCTSFFPAKPLGCYGDGGAVFTDNDDWAALVRSYAIHGKGSMKYDNVRLGVNSRLDTIQAAILQVKLRAFAEYELDDVNAAADMYAEALKGSNLVLPSIPQGFYSSWAQYTVQLPEGVDRAEMQAGLKERGIPSMVYYPKPMHEQLAFCEDTADRRRCICIDGCPVTKKLCDTVLSLPMGPYVIKDDTAAVSSDLMQLLQR